MKTAFLLFVALHCTLASDQPAPIAPPDNNRVITEPQFVLPFVESSVAIVVNEQTYNVDLSDFAGAGTAFNEMDEDKNKELSSTEVITAFRNANTVDPSNGLTSDELQDSPFKHWAYKLSPNGEVVESETVNDLYKIFDIDGDGKVTMNEVLVFKTYSNLE